MYKISKHYMSTKTIKINPNLFNGNGSTRKNRGGAEKIAKPIVPIQINENSLKKKFLNRIKEHKNKEKIENGIKSASAANEIKMKEQIANNTNDSDEFHDSIQYLSLLSKKKKEEGEKKKNMAKLQTKTVKNPYSLQGTNIPPFVELELPEELKEPIHVVPETPVMNLNFDDNYKNYFNNRVQQPQQVANTIHNPSIQTHIPTHQQYQPPKPIQTPNFQIANDPPYGCLKNASKPTYRNWVQTKRNLTDMSGYQENTPSNINFSHEPQNERQKRLEQLRKKMKEDEMNRLNSFKSSQNGGSGLNNEKPHDSPTIATSNSTPKNEPETKLIKRTIKKKYTLGKSNIYRKVGILIKNNATRKKIINAQKDLKKKPIHDIKKYLVERGLLKVGSNAPNNVLRKTYESAMLTGEVTNQNKDTLIHNLMNDTGEHH